MIIIKYYDHINLHQTRRIWEVYEIGTISNNTMREPKYIFYCSEPKLHRNHVKNKPSNPKDDKHDEIMLNLVNERKYEELQLYVDTHEINNVYVNPDCGFNALHAAVWLDDLKSTEILLKKGMSSGRIYSCLRSGKRSINILDIARSRDSINVLRSSYVRSSVDRYFPGKYGGNNYLIFNVIVLGGSQNVNDLAFDLVHNRRYDKLNGICKSKGEEEHNWLELAICEKKWKFAEMFIKHRIFNIENKYFKNNNYADNMLYHILTTKAPIDIIEKITELENIYPHEEDALHKILHRFLKLFRNDYSVIRLINVLHTFLRISKLKNNLPPYILQRMYILSLDLGSYELCKLCIDNGIEFTKGNYNDMKDTDNVKIVQATIENGSAPILYSETQIKKLIENFGNIQTWLPESYTISLNEIVVVILTEYKYDLGTYGVEHWKKCNYKFTDIKTHKYGSEDKNYDDDVYENAIKIVNAILIKNGIHCNAKYLPSIYFLIDYHTNEEKLIDMLHCLRDYLGKNRYKAWICGGLYIAIINKFDKVVESLLQNGADPNILITDNNYSGLTPLAMAIFVHNIPIFNLLKKWGAKMETKNSHVLCTIVSKAKTHYPLIHLIMLIIINGADINRTDSNGDTPLHVAAKTRQKKTCKMLIQCNADPAIKNNNGKYPHDLTNETLKKILDEYYRKWIGCGSTKPAAAR